MVVPFNLKFYYDIDLPQNCQFTAQRKHICQKRNKVYLIFCSPLPNENVTTGLSMEAILQNKTFSVDSGDRCLLDGERVPGIESKSVILLMSVFPCPMS